VGKRVGDAEREAECSRVDEGGCVWSTEGVDVLMRSFDEVVGEGVREMLDELDGFVKFFGGGYDELATVDGEGEVKRAKGDVKGGGGGKRGSLKVGVKGASGGGAREPVAEFVQEPREIQKLAEVMNGGDGRSEDGVDGRVEDATGGEDGETCGVHVLAVLHDHRRLFESQ